MAETRKLAAILASDVVGYSRLAGTDEDRILARLRALRSDLIDPIVAVHNGRVVKRTGDGAIVEFRSVVDAVRCAIEVQNGMAERNAGLAPERRIEFRIGIHVGDVVEESDGDLMGDGVNIAARVEGIAKPGAICLSEDAYRQVKSRLDLAVSDLGAIQLKNIAEPVRVYSLEVGKAAHAKATKPAAPKQRPIFLLLGAGIVALIAIAGSALYFLGANRTSTVTSNAPATRAEAAHPPKDQLTICFAHVAYRLRERFLALATGIESFEVRDGAALEQRIGEADVLVISGLWRNDLLPRAKRLRFIQSIGAGTDQFSREALKQHGVRPASARGVNASAVAEHVMAMMLALARRLPEARDNQARRVWRGMIGDFTQREDELGGKTLLIVGLGQIGGRLAQLAKAFDMRVIGIRRDPRAGAGHADAVHAMSELNALLPQADFVALTFPLTAETEKLIDADALGRMKPSAYLLSAARGRVVDEPALVDALARRQIRGAALDVMVEEPLPAASPLWAMENVLITPHTAGETCRYEDDVLAIMQENLARLLRGETELLNQVV